MDLRIFLRLLSFKRQLADASGMILLRQLLLKKLGALYKKDHAHIINTYVYIHCTLIAYSCCRQSAIAMPSAISDISLENIFVGVVSFNVKQFSNYKGNIIIKRCGQTGLLTQTTNEEYTATELISVPSMVAILLIIHCTHFI